MARRSNRDPVPPGWNSSGNQAMYRGTSRGPNFARRGGRNTSVVTSASGTPGPAGVLTTGHYSNTGQRMYGGYSEMSGRGSRSGYNFQRGGPRRRLDTPDAQANARRRRQLPPTR